MLFKLLFLFFFLSKEDVDETLVWAEEGICSSFRYLRLYAHNYFSMVVAPYRLCALGKIVFVFVFVEGGSAFVAVVAMWGCSCFGVRLASGASLERQRSLSSFPEVLKGEDSFPTQASCVCSDLFLNVLFFFFF